MSDAGAAHARGRSEAAVVTQGRPLELWQAGYAAIAVRPGEGAALEAEGWDGKMAMDSQALAADPYVVLAALAVDSERLLLGTSVWRREQSPGVGCATRHGPRRLGWMF